MKKYFTINPIIVLITVGIFISNNVFSQVQLIISPSQTLICAGSCATLTTSFQGGGSYSGTYSWTPTTGLNSATSSSVVACPTVTTTYTCVFNATAGWNSNANSTVSLNPLLNLSISVTNAQCGYIYGYIDLSVTGGTAPYTYHWSNSSTTEDIGPITVATYSVTVIDAAGCTATTSASVASVGVMNIGQSSTAPTCGNANGAINITMSGNGSPPYHYLWSNGVTTQDLHNIYAGFYSLTVTNSIGCTKFINQLLNNSNGPNPNMTSYQNASCNILNGFLDITVVSGVQPYQYLWNNGATTQDLNNIDAGTYSLTVTDAIGCTGINFPWPIFDPYPILSLTGHNSTCGLNYGWIGVSVTNDNANSPYYCHWNNGQVTGPNTGALLGVSSGNYSVTVIDNGGCSASASVTINNTIGTTIAHSEINSSCGNSDGAINLSITGGVSPYTFSWNNGSTSEDLQNIPSGIYFVTVSDINNCTAILTDTVNGFLPAALSVSIQSGTQTFCVGGNALLSVSPLGISYQWKKNNVAISGATNSIYTATLTGNYKCTITFSCGTVTTSGIQITRLATPSSTITAAGATTFCAGQSVTLNVNVQSGVTYQWKKGSAILTGATNSSYIATTAGNYKCVVTKTSTGCTKTSNQIHITINCRQEETISENTFSVYPNPFVIQFFLELKSVSDISVYNLIGEKLIDIKNASGTVTLGEELYSGMYILEIKNEQGETSVKKIVKAE